IELIAGEIFIRGMKIKLWDYSARWGNFQGIICPLFSLIWALVGAAYVLWINPLFDHIVAGLLSNILATGMVESFLYGILAVDLGMSFGLATKIRKAVADRRLVVDWDKIKVSFQDHFKRLKKTPDWALPFKTKGEQFSQMMSEYVEGLRLENAQRTAVLRKKIELRAAKRKEKAEKKNKKENP
ncbi:MAG: putative ABC transporter permease, partial [Bacilli bacterium]